MSCARPSSPAPAPAPSHSTTSAAKSQQTKSKTCPPSTGVGHPTPAPTSAVHTRLSSRTTPSPASLHQLSSPSPLSISSNKRPVNTSELTQQPAKRTFITQESSAITDITTASTPHYRNVYFGTNDMSNNMKITTFIDLIRKYKYCRHIKHIKHTKDRIGFIITVPYYDALHLIDTDEIQQRTRQRRTTSSHYTSQTN